jgi:predicted aspartyl protease
MTIRHEVVEEFTFRDGTRSFTTANAVIDTGAQQTCITQAVVDALELDACDASDVSSPGHEPTIAVVYRCLVAWTMYEEQGFASTHDVLCLPGAEEVLIGFDFLRAHELSMDMQNHGLVGTAPEGAVPLTGGGYVLNMPRGDLLKLNGERANAAKPGAILRPHPAWRFKLPALIKK